jgi:hypothetical protein
MACLPVYSELGDESDPSLAVTLAMVPSSMEHDDHQFYRYQFGFVETLQINYLSM